MKRQFAIRLSCINSILQFEALMKKLKRNKKLKFQIKMAFEHDVDNAFKIITNPISYPEIHPLITKVDKIDENCFECHETTTIFGIPYSFKYLVYLSQPCSNLVVMTSEVQKGVWMKLSFSIQYLQNQQFLCEEIEISGPYLVQKILSKKLKKAHYKMFYNLKRKLYMQHDDMDTDQIRK